MFSLVDYSGTPMLMDKTTSELVQLLSSLSPSSHRDSLRSDLLLQHFGQLKCNVYSCMNASCAIHQYHYACGIVGRRLRRAPGIMCIEEDDIFIRTGAALHAHLLESA